MDLLFYIKSIFSYLKNRIQNFEIPMCTEVPPPNNCNDSHNNISNELEKISKKCSKNLNYLKNKYRADICQDIMIRDFNLHSCNIQHHAFIIYIDGMIDSNLVNDFILSPLMIKNKSNTSYNKKELSSLADNIYDSLVPQNAIKKLYDFKDVFSSINMGDCVLFVDTLDVAFDFDVKGFKQRNIDAPHNEIIVRGSQEAFVENLRTNTSILRRLINNENLVIQDTIVGKFTKTSVAIGYIDGIANKSLISEVLRRVSSLDVDYITSSGQLEQLIQDSPKSIFPQVIATERPDKVINHLLDGRICIIVNGSPYVLVVPGVFVDFLSSPEDLNLKYQFANLQKLIRLLAITLALLLPGLYIAITNYHQELLPTELLFTIAASRESVPFPIFIEIFLMEASFELIREAGLRVPSPLGSTIGIVGALILGEAAVSASLVSPILIIIVAITGLCSFSIPDFSLNFTFRIYRFLYIILGYMAGFLGIAAGLFVQMAIMCNLQSFGSPYINPFASRQRSISNFFVPPTWKREQKSDFLHPYKKNSQGKYSMLWRKK
ncbi:MAG: spore germination protein [Clostridia bacterium]|nr:spore germination protein [Clostridia bacterium]